VAIQGTKAAPNLLSALGKGGGPPIEYELPPWSDECPPAERRRLLADQVYGLFCDGAIELPLAFALLRQVDESCQDGHGWHRMRAWLRVVSPGATLGDLAIAALYELHPTRDKSWSLGKPLAAGASVWDLLALRDVHGYNYSGEDLPGLAMADLQRRMLAVQQRAADGAPTRWLERYAHLLADESRRRRS
jgi:hypothetical protein